MVMDYMDYDLRNILDNMIDPFSLVFIIHNI